jgi:hypothetical protein
MHLHETESEIQKVGPLSAVTSVRISIISLLKTISLLEVVKCQCERRKKNISISADHGKRLTPHTPTYRGWKCHVLRGHYVTKCFKKGDSPSYVVIFPLQNEHTSKHHSNSLRVQYR